MAVNVRSVTARLDADIAGYVAKMRLAGRETDKAFAPAHANIDRLNRGLGVTSSRLGVVTSDLGKLGQRVGPLNSSSGDQSIAVLGRNSERSGASIDKLSGRLRIMTDLVAILGPGLVPISAIGLPAIAGLGAVAASSALGVITLVSSFQGVGTALQAVNKAALEPTTENLNAARDAMQQLAPETRAFVREVQDARPVLDDLRDAGAEEFFPGLIKGIDTIESRVPEIEHILASVGSALGDIAQDDAADLASARWNRFFDFLATEAPSTLRQLDEILRSTAHGATEVIMALDPGSDDFLSWVGKAADGFDRWASSSQGRSDIRAFLDYARQNGPEVADAFTSILNAVAQIVQAAGPLGGTVLTSLARIADVVANIADSDIGTPLIIAFSALSLYNRGLSVMSTISGTTIGKMVKGEAEVASGWTKASATARTFAADVNNVARYGTLATESSKRLGSQLATIGKGGAFLGGLALQASGAADSLGLANTTSLALMGTIGGPWGAAIGAGIGLLLDFKAANDDANVAVDNLTTALAQGSDQDITAAYDSAITALAQLRQDREEFFSLEQLDEGPGAFIKSKFNALAGDAGALSNSIDAANDSMGRSDDVANIMGNAIGETAGSMRQAAADAELLATQLGYLEGFFDRRSAIRNYQQSLDDLHAELANGAKVWDQDAKAGRDNQAALDAYGTSILQVADKITNASKRRDFLQDAREHLQALQKQFPAAAGAIQKVIDKLNSGLDGFSKHRPPAKPDVDDKPAQGKIDRLKHGLDEIGSQRPRPTLDANDRPAKQKITSTEALILDLTGHPYNVNIHGDASDVARATAAARAYLDSLHDKTIYIHVHQDRVGSGMGPASPPAGADGMTVPGPRHPYGDKTLIWAAPGEEVITNRHGEADRFRTDREAGRIPAYAEGGRVTSTYARTRGNDGFDAVGRAAHHSADELDKNAEAAKKERDQREKNLHHQADQVQAEIDKFRSQLDTIRSAVAGAYQTNIFESTKDFTGIGFTPAQLEAQGMKVRNQQLHANIANTREAIRLLGILQDRGLDGAAFVDMAASGDVDTLRAYVHLSKKELRSYERSYEKAARLDRQLQNLVGADVKDELRAANRRLDRIQHELAHTRHENKKNSDDNAGKVTAGVNGAASNGRRGRRAP